MLDGIETQPLDSQLNDAVLYIAGQLVPTFIVSRNAPSTYPQLKDHMDSGKDMIVFEGGSENTIFGTPEVNYAFRAWHDWCHWKGKFDFSLQGEMETCCFQLQHLHRFYGLTSKTCRWRSILIAEVVGQRRYFEKYREYILDQRSFAVAYIANSQTALQRRW